MIRVNRGKEVRPGIWEWRVPALALEGRSHQPLLDGCRAIKSMAGDTSRRVGLFWPGKDVPSLTCTVEVGASLTVSEPASGNSPRFVKYKPFEAAGLLAEAAE